MMPFSSLVLERGAQETFTNIMYGIQSECTYSPVPKLDNQPNPQQYLDEA